MDSVGAGGNSPNRDIATFGATVEKSDLSHSEERAEGVASLVNLGHDLILFEIKNGWHSNSFTGSVTKGR